MSGRRAIILVAEREIRERLRSKAFLISTLVILLVVGGSTALGGALSKETTYRVAVTAPAPPGLAVALQRAAEPFDDANVQLRVVASPTAGRQALEAEEVDALLLLSEDRLVFRSDVDAKAAAVADTAVRMLRRHLPPEPELRTATLHPAEDGTTDAATLVAYAGSLFLLASLVFYGQWVVTGVVEEKNNRVVELILSTVRPRHLLAGKVIGIGLLGLAQLALIAGLAATLLAAGAFDAPRSLGGDVALVIPWFVLGFALYAVAYAAAGALASGQQNADTAGQPVSYTLLAVYFAGYVALSVDMDGVLANLLTVFPLTAPLVARTQRTRGRAPLGARAGDRPRPRLDLRARPVRRPRLCPRHPPRRPRARRTRGVAPRPRALTEPAQALPGKRLRASYRRRPSRPSRGLRRRRTPRPASFKPLRTSSPTGSTSTSSSTSA